MVKLTYVWTPAMDCQLRQAYAKLGPKKRVGAALDLMVMATGFPRHNVSERAQRLGITVRKTSRVKPWTEEETMCVQAWMGHKPVLWIARELHRGKTIVQREMDRLMFDAQQKGLTREQVATQLGVDRSVIVHWIFKKEIALNEYGKISKSQVEAFFERRHGWLDLRMVDQRYLHRRIAKLISERPCYQKRNPTLAESRGRAA